MYCLSSIMFSSLFTVCQRLSSLAATSMGGVSIKLRVALLPGIVTNQSARQKGMSQSTSNQLEQA